MQSNTEMFYVPRAHSFLCFSRLCLKLNPRRYFDSRSFQKRQRHSHKEMECLLVQGALHQISHCRSKIRSVTPEETVKEMKSEKTCKLVHSLILPFSPREWISLRCNTNPLIKLSWETISVYNSKPVCSDSE